MFGYRVMGMDTRGRYLYKFLASCPFDGTGKIRSTRDMKMLMMVWGHEGKVIGIDALDGPGCEVVTREYDNTLKL